MLRLKFEGLLIALVLVLFAAGNVNAAPEARQRIRIVDFAFQPASVTVHVGDSVAWKNFGMVQHTSTSDTGLWDSGPLNPGQIFFIKVPRMGTFTYHCSIHPNMTGTINVVQ